ncbi:MAG: sugar phosphate isomerase/epimerase family protein [Puniceicoccaceae bacterium]
MSKLESFFNRPIGIFSWALSPDPATCAKRAVEHGFSCLQWGFPFELPEEEKTIGTARETQAIYSDHGLDVVALAGYQNLVAHDPGYKTRAIRRLEQYIELSDVFPASTGVATETGTKNRESQWHGHADNLKPESWDEMIASMHRIGAAAKAAGTKILIEGYVENVVRTADDLLKLQSQVDMEAFGFVMDPFNLFLEEQVTDMPAETGRIFAVMGDRVGIAHAKDLQYVDGVITTPRSGTGMFDFQTYFKLLDEHLPGVPLILEHLEAHEVAGTLDFLKSEYESYQNS